MKLSPTLYSLLVPALLAGQAPAAPAVGDVAPDWTLIVASSEGVSTQPLSLASLRGKPVVLAFFPRARTRGCTIQMETYRDRFGELFGTDVQLIAISRDTPEDLASWAKDASFPFRFASDVDGVAGRAYGALAEGRQWESRHLYVIDAAGKITAVMRPFREIDPTAYDELKTAVAAARSATP
jgi:peroxiredoxin Q/BCP